MHCARKICYRDIRLFDVVRFIENRKDCLLSSVMICECDLCLQYQEPIVDISDMPVDNVKDLVEVTATLKLSPVSYSYAGQWKCVATSNQGSAEKIMNLGVECKFMPACLFICHQIFLSLPTIEITNVCILLNLK